MAELKIGDFSLLAHVSVKTLRYYEQRGLLFPLRIDEATGYRYYSVEQLPRLNRILALKDLGFSLEQIDALLRDHLDSAHLRGMLTLKRAEIQQVIESEQDRLVRIEARLRQIEQEHLVSEYDIILKSVAPQRVAAIRGLILARSEIGAWMNQSFQDILAFLQEHHASQRAHGIALWHDQEYREVDLDAEAAIPTADALPPHPRVNSYELPAVETMACTVHQGSFSTLDRAYAALFAWVGENGYVVCGATREFYLHFDAGDAPSSFVTELQFPVHKGAAPSSRAP